MRHAVADKVAGEWLSVVGLLRASPEIALFFFSVPLRGPRSVSVLKNPWPDTRWGGEWLDTNSQITTMFSTLSCSRRWERRLIGAEASRSVFINDIDH
jgi:hypothetical protein